MLSEKADGKMAKWRKDAPRRRAETREANRRDDMKCKNSNRQIAGPDLKRSTVCKPSDKAGYAVCRGCGRTLKLQRHPSSSYYVLIPRHNLPKESD